MTPTPSYWKLTNEEREAFADYGHTSGLPDSIGGHSLDPTQAASCLYVFVRNHYPINEVPNSFLIKLALIEHLAKNFEREAAAIIEEMCAALIAKRTVK